MPEDRFAAQKASARETLKWLCAILGAAAAALAAGIAVADVPSLPGWGLILLGLGAALFFGATACILRLALRALVAAPYTYLSIRAEPDTLMALAGVTRAILPPHVQALTATPATGLASEAARITTFLDRHDWLYDQIRQLRHPQIQAQMTALHAKTPPDGVPDPQFARHAARLEELLQEYEKSLVTIATIQESGSLLSFNRMIHRTFSRIGWLALPAGLGLLAMLFAMAQKPVAGTPLRLNIAGGWAEWGQRLQQSCGPLPESILATTPGAFPDWHSHTIPAPLACAGLTVPLAPGAD